VTVQSAAQQGRQRGAVSGSDSAAHQSRRGCARRHIAQRCSSKQAMLRDTGQCFARHSNAGITWSSEPLHIKADGVRQGRVSHGKSTQAKHSVAPHCRAKCRTAMQAKPGNVLRGVAIQCRHNLTRPCTATHSTSQQAGQRTAMRNETEHSKAGTTLQSNSRCDIAGGAKHGKAKPRNGNAGKAGRCKATHLHEKQSRQVMVPHCGSIHSNAGIAERAATKRGWAVQSKAGQVLQSKAGGARCGAAVLRTAKQARPRAALQCIARTGKAKQARHRNVSPGPVRRKQSKRSGRLWAGATAFF
jgi:hypothetical protein